MPADGDGSIDVPVVLTSPAGDEVVIYVEARSDGYDGEVEVSNRMVDGLGGVLESIRLISGQVAAALKDLSPNKFTVELGFEMKAEAGGLVAMLVRTGGSASVKVTLEWEKGDADTLNGSE